MLKSRKAKHGWVGIGAQRSHGKPNGKYMASVVAPGSGAEPRIVLGGGFPTREVRHPKPQTMTLASVVRSGPRRRAVYLARRADMQGDSKHDL